MPNTPTEISSSKFVALCVQIPAHAQLSCLCHVERYKVELTLLIEAHLVTQEILKVAIWVHNFLFSFCGFPY